MTTHPVTTRYRLALVTAAALAVAGLPAVQAAETGGARSVTVRYDDLNLGTDVGVRTLYARLTRAAEMVCPDRFTRELARASDARACRAQAIDAAVAQVNNPRLAALRARGAQSG
jgi:UrcA family protein